VNQESDGAGPPITDFKEACRIINTEISPLLRGKDILALKKIDEALLNFQKKKAEQEPSVMINDAIIRACSEAVLYAYPFSTAPATPYQSLYRYLRNRDLQTGPMPRFIFNVLNGGKALASKVKFSRFFLILDVSPEDEVDAMEIYLKIQA
jgi:enolase